MGNRRPAHEAGRGWGFQAASQNEASGLLTEKAGRKACTLAEVVKAGHIIDMLWGINDAVAADLVELVYADITRERRRSLGQHLASLSLRHATEDHAGLISGKSSSWVTHTHIGG